ncbi:uncharacterized protein LOC118438877 [Folsomia candida]|uniref:Uncharacterized protein n=1 Tax=Folsomia candida TaxID=158441 RepID=A0A226D988_FOLCA|nr:uncharacterized protein LOC118438877 [Folsomia candida]OXA42115.1 hypothetical protein Fcan01_23217 [Folsomia candida]
MAESLPLEKALENLHISKPPKKQAPCFVINVIAHVPDVQNPAEISDEECDWEMDQGIKLGGVKLRMVTLKDPKLSTSSDSNWVHNFIHKLEQEALNCENCYHPDFTHENIAIVIFLNRMLSLSKAHNQAAVDEYRVALNINQDNVKIKFKVICGFWQRKLYKLKDKEITYEEAVKIYERLDAKHREIYLSTREKGVSVPYQSLRENLKNSQETKDFVKHFRNQDAKMVYLSLIDSDTVNFNGIYCQYYDLAETQSPTVMSTGYNFELDTKSGDGFKIASELDRQIRIKTASYFPFGVYYPEPNTCILISPKTETLEESFIDLKRGDGNGLESAVLLGNIIQKRQKSKNLKFLFYRGNPLITRIPDRARKVKVTNQDITFSPQLTQRLQVLRKDIDTCAKISQTHFDHYNWFTMLNINKGFTYNTKEFKNIGKYAEANEPHIKKCLKKRYDYTCKSLLSMIGKGNGTPVELNDAVTILKKLISPPEIMDLINLAAQEIRRYKNDNKSLLQTAYAAMIQELFTDLEIPEMVHEIAELLSKDKIDLQTVEAVCEKGHSFPDAQKFKWHCFNYENGVTWFIEHCKSKDNYEDAVEFVKEYYWEDVDLVDIEETFCEGDTSEGYAEWGMFINLWGMDCNGVPFGEGFDAEEEDIESMVEYYRDH